MKMLKLIPILLLLSACTTLSGKQDTPQITAGKTLLALRNTIVATREAISIPCQKGYIAQTDCQQMDSIYKQSKPVYDACVDSAVLAINSGAASDVNNFNKNQQQLQTLTNEIVSLALKYNIKGESN